MGAGRRHGIALFLGLSACGDAGAGEGLRLLEFRQRDFEAVALNEELLFYFSEDLERGSVTTDSVRVVDEGGREVAGTRSVRRNALSFLPELPRASDLSDGGFLPASSYRVVLGGFPRPDGLRGESGALLSAALLLSFRTAGIGDTSPLFLDPGTGPSPLRLRGTPSGDHVVLDDGRIVLECGEALDPTSVPHCRFVLWHYPPQVRGGEGEEVPLDARLIANRRDRAELVLERAGVPGVPLDPDTYYLEMPRRELRTLGQRTVEPLWRRDLLKLVVPLQRFELDFTALRERSTEPPPGCAGTALWGEGGAGLRVRYPAAAGSGEAGAVELAGRMEGADLQATELSVPAGAEVNLSARVGPVVLRSQTSLEVRGSLLRRGERARENDELRTGLEGLVDLPESQRTPLSAWIQDLLDPAQTWAREPWTVLIAGGDIRVPRGGRIEVDGPLVLVAGGWIRVEGTAYSDSYVWRTPEGGGMSARRVAFLPLLLDPPKTNPLRTTLVVGALTGSARRGRDWRTVLASHGGDGRIVTELLPLPASPQGQALPSGQPWGEGFRLLVRLEVGAGQGEPWNPPWLARLTIESRPRGGGELGERGAR